MVTEEGTEGTGRTVGALDALFLPELFVILMKPCFLLSVSQDPIVDNDGFDASRNQSELAAQNTHYSEL